MAQKVEWVGLWLIRRFHELIKRYASFLERLDALCPFFCLAPLRSEGRGRGTHAAYILSGVVRELDHPELLAVGIKLVDKMSRNFNRAIIHVVLSWRTERFFFSVYVLCDVYFFLIFYFLL